MSHSMGKEAPAVVFNICLAVVGFLVSLGWCKVTGKEADRDYRSFPN